MEEYTIAIEGQLGTRYGFLRLNRQNDKLSGSIFLLGTENAVAGEMAKDKLILHHELKTAVSTLKCVSVLTLKDEELTGEICCDFGRMRICGSKIKNEIPE